MQQPDATTTLLTRTRQELAAQFDLSKSYLIEHAPGILDVMGGIAADDEGAMAFQMPIDRSAAVLMQPREDRDLQIFSFNLFDEHLPFTFRMPLDRLATASIAELAKGLAEPGRRFAAHVAGCVYVLHEKGLIDLRDPQIQGLNFATYSAIPEHAQLGHASAIEVATMKILRTHFRIDEKLDDVTLAKLCRRVSTEIARKSSGIREPLAALAAKAGEIVAIDCQAHELLSPIVLPAGFAIQGIFAGVRPDDLERRTSHLRTASRMGHAIMLSVMQSMGRAAGRELVADPMRGYLANLDHDDYKRFFRPSLPDSITGQDFLSRYEATSELISEVNLDQSYRVRGAVDHHVLEARRIVNFRRFIDLSRELPLEDKQRFIQMDKAGHLMYASHQSYMIDAAIGSEQADAIVRQVRSAEKQGLYGARIAAGGCGGAVVILSETIDIAMRKIEQIGDCGKNAVILRAM